MALLLRSLPHDTPDATAMRWLLALGATVTLSYLLVLSQYNLLAAAMVLSSLVLVSLWDISTAAVLTLAYLFVLGDVRRLLTYFAGPIQSDPLLLVGPAVTAIIALPSLLRNPAGDGLSRTMLLLLILMGAQVLNPVQGGLSVGLTGALFYIVPLLWFWIGRDHASPRVVQAFLYRVLLPLGLAAAVMGLSQTVFGFLPYQQAWIDSVSRTYAALYLGTSIRAFGFSISAAEYATLMVMATAAILAANLAARRDWALALSLLLPAIILASGRSSLIKLVVAVGVIWSLRRQSVWNPVAMVKALAYAALALGLVLAVASRFAASGPAVSKGAVDEALTHQVQGLAHPFDQRYSTAGLHRDMLMSALAEGFRYPVGHGLGSTTLGATRFGGDASIGSSEIDFGDMFITLGFIGGLAYLAMVAQVVRAAVLYLHCTERSVSLPTLAILLSTLASWLIAGQYATSCTIFFMAGGLIFRSNPIPTLNRQDPAMPPGTRSMDCNSNRQSIVVMNADVKRAHDQT